MKLTNNNDLRDACTLWTETSILSPYFLPPTWGPLDCPRRCHRHPTVVPQLHFRYSGGYFDAQYTCSPYGPFQTLLEIMAAFKKVAGERKRERERKGQVDFHSRQNVPESN